MVDDYEEPEWLRDVPLPDGIADYYDPPRAALVDVLSPGKPNGARVVTPTPYVWRDPLDIPPRRWLYGRHLLRRFVSVDVAPGGVGKSSLKIVEALSMASGKAIFRPMLHEPRLRVWLYNLEDPFEEIERRLAAAMIKHGIDPRDIADRLFVDSGRDQPCIIAEETPNGARICRPVVDSLEAGLREREIDVLMVDPFVSSHALSENDNRAIDLVVKEWGRLADRCDCSINLVHHVRKSNGEDTTADSARGAKALVDAARSVVVYNRMTKEEAREAQVPEEQARFYFRTVVDKANLAPVESSDWYRMNNVDLPNGDSVGVACQWQWPSAFDGVTQADVRAIQEAIAAGRWRESVQSRDKWAGKPVARVLGLDASDAGDRRRIGKLLKEWIRSGVLVVIEEQDERYEMRPFVKVGAWVEPNSGSK